MTSIKMPERLSQVLRNYKKIAGCLVYTRISIVADENDFSFTIKQLSGQLHQC